MALWELHEAQKGQVQGPAPGPGQAPVSTQAGNIPGWVGWTSEHPDLVEGVPAYCRGVGVNYL